MSVCCFLLLLFIFLLFLLPVVGLAFVYFRYLKPIVDAIGDLSGDNSTTRGKDDADPPVPNPPEPPRPQTPVVDENRESETERERRARWPVAVTDPSEVFLTVGSRNLSDSASGVNFVWQSALTDMVIAFQELVVPKSIAGRNAKVGDLITYPPNKNNQWRVNYMVYAKSIDNANFQAFGLAVDANCGLDILVNETKAFLRGDQNEKAGVLVIKVRSRVNGNELFLGSVDGFSDTLTDPRNVEAYKEAIEYVRDTPFIMLGDYSLRKSWWIANIEQVPLNGRSLRIHPKNDCATSHDDKVFVDIDYALYIGDDIRCLKEGQLVSRSKHDVVLFSQMTNFKTKIAVVNAVPVDVIG